MVHHKTLEKQAREAAAAKAAQEAAEWVTPNTENTELPPDTWFTPAQSMDAVFWDPGEAPVEQKMISLPEAEWKKFLTEHNQMLSEMNQGKVIDPHETVKRKRTLRIAFYTDIENETYIVKDLVEQTKINGSKFTTWNKGIDEETKQPITWIQPVLQHLETNVVSTPIIKYADFMDLISTIPLEVKDEKAVQVDTTGIEEFVNVTDYQDTANGRLNAVNTGVKVRASVIAIVKTYTVEYKEQDFQISDRVVNIL